MSVYQTLTPATANAMTMAAQRPRHGTAEAGRWWCAAATVLIQAGVFRARRRVGRAAAAADGGLQTHLHARFRRRLSGLLRTAVVRPTQLRSCVSQLNALPCRRSCLLPFLAFVPLPFGGAATTPTVASAGAAGRRAGSRAALAQEARGAQRPFGARVLCSSKSCAAEMLEAVAADGETVYYLKR